ncbi:peptidoglycan binding domain-containing protein, partial [Streptomyces sp. NPDC057052]|uniref:peptidoglycan binding domain-containing protein n=1 Tax=Streptomyces sp. NPDC057052 TaxID=3346010 RepID=UPI0036458E3C
DDTAILTPQQPASDPGPGGYGRHDNVSGQTVTSGIPVVPATGQGPGPGGPFAPGGHPDGPLPHTPPQTPEPVAQNAPAAGSKQKKKKGRSKLVLLGSLVVVAAAGAYGAGLLMNHSDVPKGTTVLGVDIGGGTRDDAVKKLDDAFEGRVNQALKLSVDGATVTLKPEQAGLQFDMQSTVDAAAKSDYNPVSVIGSLFGEHREIEPVMPVDEEKLQAALKNAASGSGSATDGTIKFESGKAVAVYGKAGKGIDAAKAQTAVVEAYRGQVETGTPTAVKVPTTTKQPTVPDAEVDRMMKEFAEPAMSGNVTVQTDAAHSVPMSPKNSLWKFLGVKAIDGKLVESYDEAALEELYGGAFDGVLITRGTGQKTPVTVQDVISALRPALTSTTDRLAVIDTDPS